MKLSINFFEGTRRLVAIEVAREGNLVADFGLLLVYPRVGDVGLNLGVEVDTDGVLASRVAVGVVSNG